MRNNRAKAKLKNGEPALGLWSQTASPLLVEAATTLDLDWILLDFEHGLGDAHDALALLQAGGGTRGPEGAPTLIARIPEAEPTAIKKLLDLGLEGILAPQIQTAAEAQAIVDACRYPPVGTRGIGPGRATNFGADSADYFQRINQEVLVGVQIETRQAVEEVEAIAAIDGLDYLLIGPADLSAAFGHFLDLQHADVEEVVAGVLAAARAAGKAGGYYCNTGKDAKRRIDQGFQMVNLGTDLGAMVGGIRRHIRDARES